MEKPKVFGFGSYALNVGPKATPNVPEEFCVKCKNAYTSITYNGLKVMIKDFTNGILTDKLCFIRLNSYLF